MATTKQSPIDQSVQRFQTQTERLWTSMEKHVSRYMKLADKAKTEERKKHYTKLAIRDVKLGMEQLKNAQVVITKFKTEK
jgi:hypothetical protein